MRVVAGRCRVALGTLYNYYSGKDELLIAAVESVWQDIFHAGQDCRTGFSFPDYIAHLFRCVRQGAEKYPGFFTAHSIGMAKVKSGDAGSVMERYLKHMKGGMLAVLRADPAVDPAAFSPSFTEEDLVDFVLDHLLMLLMQGKDSCEVLLVLVRRALTGPQVPDGGKF